MHSVDAEIFKCPFESPQPAAKLQATVELGQTGVIAKIVPTVRLTSYLGCYDKEQQNRSTIHHVSELLEQSVGLSLPLSPEIASFPLFIDNSQLLLGKAIKRQYYDSVIHCNRVVWCCFCPDI